MKKSATFLFFILLFVFLTPVAFSADKQSLDRIIATVNDAVITQSELTQALEMAKKQIAASGAPQPAEKVLHKQVLDHLINKQLQIELASRNGVKITDAEIDKAINTIATNYKITAADLYDKVSAEGLTKKDYRAEIHDQLLVQSVQRQAMPAPVTVSAAEVKNFLHSKPWQANQAKEYHVEDLMVPLPEGATPEQIAQGKKQAEELFAKLTQGMSFQEASTANTALQNNDLGWRKLSEIPSAFSNGLTDKKTNDMMGPIATANGFHILRLSGTRLASADPNQAAGPTPEQAQQILYQQKYEKAVQAWLTKLRGEAFIKVFS